MGDPSFLRLVPASSASIPIDWTHIPEATKKILLDGWGYDWENEVQRPLPVTIGELAKMFDESKFFGYMSPDLCTILMDISELGLKDQASEEPVFPRFYMKYLEAVWFILFFPGKRDGITGYGPDIDNLDADDKVSQDTALAQQFDEKLTQELSQRATATFMVNITKRLCGWDASMLQSNLQIVQLMEALRTLPLDHPAHIGMVRDVMSSIHRR